MAVEKNKLRALVVQVRVNIVLLCDSGEFAVIEQPNNLARTAN